MTHHWLFTGNTINKHDQRCNNAQFHSYYNFLTGSKSLKQDDIGNTKMENTFTITIPKNLGCNINKNRMQYFSNLILILFQFKSWDRAMFTAVQHYLSINSGETSGNSRDQLHLGEDFVCLFVFAFLSDLEF